MLIFLIISGVGFICIVNLILWIFVKEKCPHCKESGKRIKKDKFEDNETDRAIYHDDEKNQDYYKYKYKCNTCNNFFYVRRYISNDDFWYYP